MLVVYTSHNIMGSPVSHLTDVSRWAEFIYFPVEQRICHVYEEENKLLSNRVQQSKANGVNLHFA